MKYAEDLQPGERIKDFRGDEHVFVEIEQPPSPGRSGKLKTDQGTFFVTVFNMEFRRRTETREFRRVLRLLNGGAE